MSRLGTLLLLVCVQAPSQIPRPSERRAGQFPTAVFTSVFWAADPSYYSITVDSSGAATYRSVPDSVLHTGVPYMIAFKASERTTKAIFGLLNESGFLGKTLAHSTSSPENEPVHTLSFRQYGSSKLITYSSTKDSAVRQLTSIFERIAGTLELGHDLATAHNSGAPDRISANLDNLDRRLKLHLLTESQALAALLRSVAADKTLEPRLRRQARDLQEKVTGLP